MNKLERAQQLQDRTKGFAVRIVHAFAKLPKLDAALVIGRQFECEELVRIFVSSLATAKANRSTAQSSDR